MLTTGEKLQHFSKIVFDQARKECDEIIKSTEDEVKKTLTEYENKSLAKAYNDIQKQLKLAKKEASRKILQVKTTKKHELIRKREEMTDELFRAVEEKILEFKKTEGYAEFLKSAAKSAVSEIQANDIVIYLDFHDAGYADMIRQEFKNAEVKILDEDDSIIGGVRVISENSSQAAENTLASCLVKERDKFLSSGKLI